MHVAPEDVPEESRFLLEIDFKHIRTATTEKQSYWVHAIRAAVKAGSRRGVNPRLLRRRVSRNAPARRLRRRASTVTSSPPVPPSSHLPLPCRKRSLDTSAGSLCDPSNKCCRPD